MTETEQLADVIALVVHAETAPILTKMAVFEERPPARDGAPGRDGERGLDGKPGLDGKDGLPGERGLHGEAGAPGRDGLGLAGALITREGHLTLTLSDGTAKDLGTVIGPPGAKGADGFTGAPVAGLSPDVICASVDMLLRKELSALEAAAPPRMTKRIIRDARGKIERVIEEPARG